ncbi:MAG: serine hydrolase [Bacteroidota bacterium]
MKTYHIVLSMLFIFIQGCKSQPDGAEITQKSDLDWKNIETQIDELVQQYQSLDIFSGVILITDHSQTRYHKAFGLADREKAIKNTLDTKFDIGSMNKTFTQMVILKLVENGKLHLDDLIGNYLDGIDPVAAKKATINDLLHHTSGYGDYLTYEYDDLPAKEKTYEKTLARVKAMPLEFEPGTDQVYSNIGYILLGSIIENITGNSYFQNVQQIILDPLELKNTSMNPKGDTEQMAIGYYRTVDDQIVSNDNFIEYPKPDGGFRSTASDIVKFYNEFHYGSKILKRETKMKDDFFSAIQAHNNSGAAIPHAGGYPGANTAKYEILRDKISILVFANMDEPVAELLGAGILAIVRNQEPKSPSYPAVPNICNHYKKHGIEYIKVNFEALTQNFHPTDPRGIILNQVGYYYLNELKSVEDALKIFALNTEFFGDEDPNVWDSLGEAYYHKGEKKSALKAYNRAISIDPEFPPSLEMIRKIKSEM